MPAKLLFCNMWNANQIPCRSKELPLPRRQAPLVLPSNEQDGPAQAEKRRLARRPCRKHGMRWGSEPKQQFPPGGRGFYQAELSRYDIRSGAKHGPVIFHLIWCLSPLPGLFLELLLYRAFQRLDVVFLFFRIFGRAPLIAGVHNPVFDRGPQSFQNRFTFRQAGQIGQFKRVGL